MKRTMQAAIGIALAQVFTVSSVGAQTAEDMVISVNPYMTRTNGAEESNNMFLLTGPLAEKSAGAGRYSVGRCGAMTLAAHAEGPFEDGATSGWRVEMIPIRVNDGAVTFRLKWIRALDTGKDLHPKSEDVELTLRPGESRPMDSVLIPVDKETGRRCPSYNSQGKAVEYSAVSLRVSVEYWPFVSQERRLMSADLWLIERSPAGEKAQTLTVRGVPHQGIPFYFDAIRENALALEIMGSVIARPENDAVAVELNTTSRWGPAAFDWRKSNAQGRRSNSQVRVKPGETVEVALRKLDDSAGPFAARQYSIRVRARQLR